MSKRMVLVRDESVNDGKPFLVEPHVADLIYPDEASGRIRNIVFFATEQEQQCDLCGEIAELRHYGPNGECICIACGDKDHATTIRMMLRTLFGIPEER